MATTTLKQIAAAAGVSQMTVSKVINKKDYDIGKDTRARVLRLVEELNYLPNESAQRLKGKKTRTVNVIIPSFRLFEVEQYTRLVNGLQAYLQEKGYMLQITSLEFAFKKERLIRKIQTDGLVTFYWGAHERLLEELKNLDVPVVAVHGKCPHPGVSNVYLDQGAVMYDLTRRIIEAGHTNITYAGSYLRDVVNIDGKQGIQKAVEEEGITFNWFEIPFDTDASPDRTRGWELGHKGLEMALERFPNTTALMFNSDWEAAQAIKRAGENGLAVPEQLSITGSGDHSSNRLCPVPLTTTACWYRQMGKEAGKLLIDTLENGEAGVRSIKVTSQVVMRKSLGKVKK